MVWFPPFTLPCALTIAAVVFCYYLYSSRSGLSAWNVVFAPFAAALFMYALLRSMVTTLWQGGVVWRGTFYSLAELREHSTPLLPWSADKPPSA